MKILPELRFAIRQLSRDRGFALVAILTLGTGIGAASVVFSIFDEVVLRGLSSTNSVRLVKIGSVLMGAASLLLLLACASVSSMLLARTTNRQRELSMRAMLGALRPQVFKQIMVESQVLAFTSAAIGLLFAAWILPTIQTLGFETLPQLADASIDLSVVVFTAVLAIVTGLLCGVAPAYQASKEHMGQTLRGGEIVLAGGSQTIRNALVICQLSLAVVLLVGAGLLSNSFLRLLDASGNNAAVAVSGLRLNVILGGLFAAIALGLAALGVYAVTAFAVARRKREIGVRMALGAGPARIVGITLSRGTRLILYGTAIGLFGAFGLSRFLRSMLYEIGPSDPVTYTVVILVLILVAGFANYVPARKATKTDPRVAFVSE